MCGICGFKSKKGVESKDTIRAMTAVIKRRGPDEQGFYFGDSVAFGIRRLSIIDLHGGSQPIFNENRTVAVVCNGEIYNYKSLRKHLISKGHVFATRSDTEVIVHLYEEYGDRFVEKLDGMFAFAIHDRTRKRILLGRDRLGIKPLFISNNDNAVVFGSEIKAIRKHGSISSSIDIAAVDQFFTYTYIPQPRTIYLDIKKVPPATIVSIEHDNSVNYNTYWQLNQSIDRTMGISEWVDRCEKTLMSAVQSHLVSDVPVGAFLSGGIDSSLVVSMMAAARSDPVDTFTVGFDINKTSLIDERQFARELAKQYGLRHHELYVKPDFEEIAHDIVDAFDEPFADDSVIPTYYVCKETSGHVKVAMSGLGGDELFGGYARHYGLLLGEHYRRIPNFIHHFFVNPAVSRLKARKKDSHFVDRLKRFVRSGRLEHQERYQDSLSSLPSNERIHLYSERIGRSVNTESTENIITRSPVWNSNLPLLESSLRLDLETYLVDDVLALTDRLSMWHSLEIRVPFLDHRMVEMAATIPPEFKIKGHRQKYVLRQVAEKWVPSSILNHRKQGFEAPMGQWLAGPLRNLMCKYLGNDRLSRQGFFSPTFVENLISEHLIGYRKNSKILFSLIMFQLWLERNDVALD